MNEAMKCDRCGKMVDAVYPHTCTPLALRLANALQAGADDPMWADHCEMSKRTASLSAAELRRLHAVNEELLEALKWIERRCPELFIKEPIRTKLHWEAAYDAGACARAAIAKATGETK
jgi:hypothetical protein